MARNKCVSTSLTSSSASTNIVCSNDITDTEHFIAEDQLWAFLTATQADTLKKLADDYGTDARDEVFADALTDQASGVIVAHNHPAGSLESGKF